MAKPTCKLYKNDKGEIAVLYSPGYGAGWSSTWNFHPNIAFDKRIVEYVLEHKKTGEPIDEKVMKAYLESIGYEDVYCGGAKNLIVEFVKPGTYVRINEYDGYESLEILNLEKGYTFLE